MKKIIFALASAVTVSALSGCGSDPEDVALGMVKAIVNGDAEKAASYCSPEAKTRCNIKEAKSTIEYYQRQSALMKVYYDKAAEPEYQIGQKKHLDLSRMGGPVVDEILVIDVKNRPGSKDDPSDYAFRVEISDKGALRFPNYHSWEFSSEEALKAAAKKKEWIDPIVTEKYTLTNEQLAQKFDEVVSGKEKPSEGIFREKRPFMIELGKKFRSFEQFIDNGTDWKSDRISKLHSYPGITGWSHPLIYNEGGRHDWSEIKDTLDNAIRYTVALNPKVCHVVKVDDEGRGIKRKDYSYEEKNRDYTEYECDMDGQNYLFQRFKDYLLKDEPELVKKYSVK